LITVRLPRVATRLPVPVGARTHVHRVYITLPRTRCCYLPYPTGCGWTFTHYPGYFTLLRSLTLVCSPPRCRFFRLFTMLVVHVVWLDDVPTLQLLDLYIHTLVPFCLVWATRAPPTYPTPTLPATDYPIPLLHVDSYVGVYVTYIDLLLENTLLIDLR